MYTSGMGSLLDVIRALSSVTNTITPNGRKVPKYHRRSKELAFCKSECYTFSIKCPLGFGPASFELQTETLPLSHLATLSESIGCFSNKDKLLGQILKSLQTRFSSMI